MKKYKILSLGILVLFLISGILITLNYFKENSSSNENNRNVVNLDTSEFTPKKIETTNINLSDEITSALKVSDEKNYNENLENYKKIFVEFEIPKQYEDKIIESLNSGYSAPDIYTAYNFLYETYGKIDEVSKLLNEKNKNSGWENMFKKYDRKNKEFIPTEFKEGYIEEKLTGKNFNINDVMIADRISQRGFGEFDELLERRQIEGSWNKIKVDLGIINLEEILPSIAITSADIAKYAPNNSIKDEQVISTLAIARKANIEDENQIKDFMNLKSKEDIYSEIYKSKYEN
ncbi:hypothetical protein KPL40_19530 [Clostridium gasigenes]|uniref:hypothetical protein n=1 Tax=Clostridium gasigenes TaxID=94869 RepID=UPI001C0E6A79|nr:hypothetical protein [Clostridium gasigenes]MBU3134600.1 hypothetical protein [Clostridium gasigenes]